MEEELEEMRKSLRFLTEDISKVAKQSELMGLKDEVEHLNALMKEKDKRTENPGKKKRIDDLER